MDKETGEIYITNVDLKTGIKYFDTTQPTTPLVQEDSEVIFLENEDDYMEFKGYEQLLSAYENGEIPPALVQDAYNELSRVNLLKYLYYNPNQLSLKFPSESVQTGQILNPNEVLASKSVVSDQSVMDEIMSCITGKGIAT